MRAWSRVPGRIWPGRAVLACGQFNDAVWRGCAMGKLDGKVALITGGATH